MRPMDTPPSRPLDDDSDPADQARARPGMPDGRARPPAELLDNLRLRLSDLPANHPSASSAGGRRAAQGRAGRAGSDAAPADAVERDDALPADAAPDQAPAGHAGGRGRDHAPGGQAGGAEAGEADQRGSEAGEADQPGSKVGGADQPGSEGGGADQPGSEAGEGDQPGSESGGADQPGSEAGEADPGGLLADALRAARLTGDAAFDAGDAMIGGLGALGGAGADETYRPWFMSGEPGIPWWAGGDDLWER